MLSETELDKLVQHFFESAVVCELWGDTLQKVSDTFGAEGAALITFSRGSLEIASSEGVSELMSRFVSFPASQNQRARRGLRKGPWDVQSEGSLFDPPELDRLPLYCELLRPLGFQWFAGAALVVGERENVLLSIERKTGQGIFEPEELAVLRRILPNLRAATKMAVQFSTNRHKTALAAFDLMNVPAFLVDGRGVVLRINERGQARADTDLQVRFGRLCGSNSEHARAISDYLSGALRSLDVARNGLALHRDDAPPILLYVHPLSGLANDIFGKAQAVVTIIDPIVTRLPAIAELMAAYSLSSTEARVARAVAGGVDLAGIACHHGTSIETVRSQLKSVFAKTGISRQAELTSILTRMGFLSSHE